MVGVIEDRGRFPGRMKFASDGTYPNALDEPGVEKSESYQQVGSGLEQRLSGRSPTIHFIVHNYSRLWHHDFTAEKQVDGCDSGNSKSSMINSSDMRRSGAKSVSTTVK